MNGIAENSTKRSTSAICTLFESHYHYGLGALVNSVFASGFRGDVFAGFRGPIPPWASGAVRKGEGWRLEVGPGCAVHFLPLKTEVHLTNFKPDFMLRLWEVDCPNAENLFYFDPDIVVKCRWDFFEDWVLGGVALCEDVNSPFPNHHPIRNAWRKFYEPHGVPFHRELNQYFNCGFIGITRRDLGFLRHWQKIQEWMAPAIQGLKNVNIGDRTFLFQKTDQDALNIAAESSNERVSPIGKEGMDFVPGWDPLESTCRHASLSIL